MNPCDDNPVWSLSVYSVRIDFKTCFVFLCMSYWILDPRLVFLHYLMMPSSFENFNLAWKTLWQWWNLIDGS